MRKLTRPRLWSTIFFLFVLLLSGCEDSERNGYMLADGLGKKFGVEKNPLAQKGYDWWWHSFVGYNRETGEARSFFIEYYIINPGLGKDVPVFGQLPENKANGIRPSYAMIKAGSWAKNDSAEINNFYGVDQFSAQETYMDVKIGDNIATETQLVGSVSMGRREAKEHPEYMSDAGSMSWNLEVNKVLSYSVGYGANEFFRTLNGFQMFWHIQGMKTEFSGEVIYNGEVYDITPERSYGYQDKNWGTDYTNPWIWLNCNNFVSEKTGEALPLTSLDVGGGNPTAFDISLGKKVLLAFYHEGELYEYNFTNELQKQDINVTETETEFRWQVEAEDVNSRIVVDFKSPKDTMLHIDYENPMGEKNHKKLWNGGWASGTVSLYKRTLTGWKLIDTFHGSMGGCEYGEY